MTKNMIVFYKSSNFNTWVLKFIFCSICFFYYSCSSPNKVSNCSNFKIGKFGFQSDFDGSRTVIERNDSIQTETNQESGNIIKARIKWTGRCEYELYFLSQDANSQDTIHSFLQTRALKTRLLKMGKDYCIFESSVEGVELKLVDTLRILNN